MKLITLAKKLDFATGEDYFIYCLESYVNGNFNQCKELFKAMTKSDRKEMLRYIKPSDKNSIDFEAYEFYYDLL